MGIAERLLAWYDAYKRELPWRENKDAYRVWVSEIMLQQTRVEAVKGYYERWMEVFPNPAALAAADEDQVVKQWEGLGYYSRARNLLAGVREVCAQYGGQVPEDEGLVRALPGVGEYTAGAILSIAYDKRIPAVDGNVMRIFSRLFALADDILKPAAKRQVRQLVAAHMSAARPGDFNQALMDLGSAVCIPKRPRCEQCPLQRLCQAREQGIEHLLPVRTPKKEPLPVALAAALIVKDDCYLVRKRPPGGVLTGMWEFPAIELETAQKNCPAALVAGIRQQLGQQIVVNAEAYHFIHVFSHRKWDISFYQCSWLDGGELPAGAQWAHPDSWSQLAWAGPHRKAAQAIEMARLAQ